MDDQYNPEPVDQHQAARQQGHAPMQHQPGAVQAGFGPSGKMIRPWSYPPSTFRTLYTWWMVLLLAGIPLSFLLLGIPMLIASVVLGYIFLYKCWNQIQDGFQRTTPGKAVGFMFIPFFNLYWMFVAIHGLSQDLNAYGKRHGVQMMPVNESLGLTYCILVLCTIVPYLGLLAMIAAIVIGIIVMGQFKNASVQIAQHNGGGVA